MRLECAKNPKWANAERTMIDLTTKWVGIGEELPFTASPDDCEEHGRALFAAALRGEYGSIAEFVPLTPTHEEMAEQVRAERNRLLAESDWTQLPDASASMGEAKAVEWDAYRQALRDIPGQEGFPNDVVWPVKPE